MAELKMPGKRRRDGGTTKGTSCKPAQDKVLYQCRVLLHREIKKIRTFQVRKNVKQLKQLRLRWTQRQPPVEEPNAITSTVNASVQQQQPQDQDDDAAGASDAAASKKTPKHQAGKAPVPKLDKQIRRQEHELAILKSLDLALVVQQAIDQTGFYVFSSEYQEAKRRKTSVDSQEDAEEDGDGLIEYEDSASDEEEPLKNDPSQQQQQQQQQQLTDPNAKAIDDTEAIRTKCIHAILAHKQLQPTLDNMKKAVEKHAREQAKKEQKKLLKKARGRGNLVGGRSAAMPTSLFLGALSEASSGGGRASRGSNNVFSSEPFGQGFEMAGEDDAFGGIGHEDDDDDDMDDETRARKRVEAREIADFLGETNKKKNRPGQRARRQKALEREAQEERRQHPHRPHGKQPAKGTRDHHHQERGNRDGRHPTRRKAPPLSNYQPRTQAQRDFKVNHSKAASASSSSSSSLLLSHPPRGAPRSREQTPNTAKPSRGNKDHRGGVKPIANATKAKDEVMHPSWQAKQQLKAKQKVDLQAFSGKKITFDD